MDSCSCALKPVDDASVTQNFKRDGSGVTSPILNDGSAAYTPGISERRGSDTTYMHSGIKNAERQTDVNEDDLATRTYDAFGNITNATGTWQGPFGHAGQFGYQEDASGLQLLGHRFYDPSLGRFLTRDPIQDGRNWYTYCGNNPVSAQDHSGLSTGVIAPALPGSSTWLSPLTRLAGGIIAASTALAWLITEAAEAAKRQVESVNADSSTSVAPDPASKPRPVPPPLFNERDPNRDRPVYRRPEDQSRPNWEDRLATINRTSRQAEIRYGVFGVSGSLIPHPGWGHSTVGTLLDAGYTVTPTGPPGHVTIGGVPQPITGPDLAALDALFR